MKRGFAVVEAEDGCHALEVIRNLQGNVSLLLSDVEMPKLDGSSLSKAVKETYPSIIVLLMSGTFRPEQLDCHSLGGFKPSPLGDGFSTRAAG